MEIKSKIYSMLSDVEMDMSVVDNVINRLESIGYIPTEKDVFTIGFAIIKVIISIKNSCGIITVPDELNCTIVDLSFANILRTFSAVGKLDECMNLNDNVTVIEVGDTKVNFDNSNVSASLELLILELLSKGECDIICFRKLRW